MAHIAVEEGLEHQKNLGRQQHCGRDAEKKPCLGGGTQVGSNVIDPAVIRDDGEIGLSLSIDDYCAED